MTAKLPHRSLPLWVAAIATAWTTLVAASLEWNVTSNRHIIEELSEAAARSNHPLDARYRDAAVLGLPLERTEFAIHGGTWSLGLLALGVAALSLRKGQRERMLTEATLRQSEERFRSLVEQAGDGFELVDVDGRIVDVNQASCRQLGYTRDELLGLSISDIDPEVTVEGYVERFHWVIGKPPVTFDAQHRRSNGTVFPVEVTTSAIRAGDRHYALSVVRDVTERKQAEEAVRESESRYRSLFDNMLNGFAYCRMIYERDRPPDFVYLAVNSAFTALTGLSDVVGKKVSEVIPGIQETDPQLLESYARVARTGMPEQFEYHLGALKMWLAVSVYSPSHDHFAAVFDVITDRIRAAQ